MKHVVTDLKLNGTDLVVTRGQLPVAAATEPRCLPMRRLLMLRHNLIAHPVAGLLWLVGWQAGGDWVHDRL